VPALPALRLAASNRFSPVPAWLLAGIPVQVRDTVLDDAEKVAIPTSEVGLQVRRPPRCRRCAERDRWGSLPWVAPVHDGADGAGFGHAKEPHVQQVRQGYGVVYHQVRFRLHAGEPGVSVGPARAAVCVARRLTTSATCHTFAPSLPRAPAIVASCVRTGKLKNATRTQRGCVIHREGHRADTRCQRRAN
jgi:hypothetical protein